MEFSKIVKTQLLQSVVRLLKTKSVDDITVNSIVADAGISRTTFYRYFSDKYDLVNYVYAQYMDRLKLRYTQSACYKQLMFDLCSFFADNRELFLKITSYTGQNSFGEYFISQTSDYVTSHYLSINNHDKLTKEEEYIVNFNSTGVYSIIIKWLSSGCIETPKMIAQIIIDSMPQYIRKSFVPFYHNDTWERKDYRDTWVLEHTPSEIELK